MAVPFIELARAAQTSSLNHGRMDQSIQEDPLGLVWCRPRTSPKRYRIAEMCYVILVATF